MHLCCFILSFLFITQTNSMRHQYSITKLSHRTKVQLPEKYDGRLISSYFAENSLLPAKRVLFIVSECMGLVLRCAGELLARDVNVDAEGIAAEALHKRDSSLVDEIEQISMTESPPGVFDALLGYSYSVKGKIEMKKKSTSSSLTSRLSAQLRGTLTRLGPAFVKFGQVLSSRPDLLPADVINELEGLVDDVENPFPTYHAMEAVEREIGEILSSNFNLSMRPIAAASLGQVYAVNYQGQKLAVKIKRPGAKLIIALDFYLIRQAAKLIDSIGAIKTNLTSVVDEFASRIYEELNYRKEAFNMEKFKALYGQDVVVPQLFRSLSSDNVLTMSWIDGTHLVVNKTSSSDLPIIEQGIKSTLNQLLVRGVLHADPHAGNILKTRNGKLAYLDFGLIAEVPEGVRESLVCGVMYLIEKNYSALALEFDSLMLMPPEDLKRDREEFTEALENVVSKILEYPNDISTSGTKVLPVLRFDSIVSSLFAVATKFNFVVPPYFLNNARAIASLEGMALSVNPKFNLLRVLYPFVVRRLLLDPSPKIREALTNLILTEDKCKLNYKKLWSLFSEASVLGLNKWYLVFHFLISRFTLVLLYKDIRYRIKQRFFKY